MHIGREISRERDDLRRPHGIAGRPRDRMRLDGAQNLRFRAADTCKAFGKIPINGGTQRRHARGAAEEGAGPLHFLLAPLQPRPGRRLPIKGFGLAMDFAPALHHDLREIGDRAVLALALNDGSHDHNIRGLAATCVVSIPTNSQKWNQFHKNTASAR